MLNEKPKKKRLNEGNIFITMVNPLALAQMAEPLTFPTNEPIGLYGRQSSLFQFENKVESRDYQIEEQRQILVTQYRWNPDLIFEYFQDFAESGTLGIGERVGITCLLEDIESGFLKAVYVFLVDRLFRDKLLENVIRFAKACYERKIIIITSCYIYRMWIQEDYEKFIDDCKLAWKALDLQLNKRMIPMRVYASHSGKYDSRTVNIGYTVDRDKHSLTYKRYIPLQKHADTVREKIFQGLVDLGGNPLALMHKLEQEPGVHFEWHDDPLFNNKIELTKIPGVGYRIAAYSTLLRILRNRVYIGTWVTGEKEYPNNHDAIIDLELWETVQYLLDKWQEQTRVHQKKSNLDSILKGLILRPYPGWTVTVSPLAGEISFGWKDEPNRMKLNRRDIILLQPVEDMFKEIFTKRLLKDEKCKEYAQEVSSLYEQEQKNKAHINVTIERLEARRKAILNDLDNPQIVQMMSARTRGERYEQIRDIEQEIERLQTSLKRQSKIIPLPDLLSLIEQLRENWGNLSPEAVRSVATVFSKGILLKPLSSHIWAFEVRWELWPTDKGIIWLNIGDKYHWSETDIATLKELTERGATTEEFLEALPKFSRIAISNQTLRLFGKRAIPKSYYRLDAYLTREDIQILEKYHIGLEPIARIKGAVKTVGLDGKEYYTTANVLQGGHQRKNIIFFLDAGRDDSSNQAAST